MTKNTFEISLFIIKNELRSLLKGEWRISFSKINIFLLNKLNICHLGQNQIVLSYSNNKIL